MKTVTLYTEEEFKERWPEYIGQTITVRKDCDRFGDHLSVRKGWEIQENLDLDSPKWKPTGTVEFFKLQLIDITGAIAHIEAHPEEQ